MQDAIISKFILDYFQNIFHIDIAVDIDIDTDKMRKIMHISIKHLSCPRGGGYLRYFRYFFLLLEL
jgi:hypothetical protein